MKNIIKICGKRFNYNKIDALYTNDFSPSLPYSESNLIICSKGNTEIFGFKNKIAHDIFSKISYDLAEKEPYQFFPIEDKCLINLRNITEINLINEPVPDINSNNNNLNNTGIVLTFNDNIDFTVETNGNLDKALTIKNEIEIQKLNHIQNANSNFQQDTLQENDNIEQ